MKKSEIEIGGKYIAKVSNKLTTVEVKAIRKTTCLDKSMHIRRPTVYDVINLSTGRKTTFQSAAKFRQVAASTAKSDRSPLNKSLKEVSGKPAPHLIIEALAGTGKTTTLVEGLKEVKGLTSAFTPSLQQRVIWDAMKEGIKPSSICFVAFNKSIATELQERVPEGCDAMTMHSMGFKAVREAFGSVRVNGFRVQDIISEILELDIREIRRYKSELLQATEKLVGLCKQNLTGFQSLEPEISQENILELAAYYDIDLNGNSREVCRLVPQVLERCKNVAHDGCIDFNDMIWLPVVLGLTVTRYNLLLMDESQDNNRCQQELARKAGDRLILCGDPKQAIYGFAGADSMSMERMRGYLDKTPGGCRTLPLTVTRRCGKAIVEEAKQYVPDFEAHEDNGEGKVLRSTMNTYSEIAEDGDMILCRVNAPLVSQCFCFLRNGRKATIQGRDVGQGLISTINKLKADDVGDLLCKLSNWFKLERQKENRKKMPSDTRLIALQDRRDCIECFCEEKITVEEVIDSIKAIFSDEENGVGVKFSSVHKAKGLEANNVYLLQPEGATIPHPMARTKWQREQELNILYVAITRAKNTLVYVS